MNGPFTMRTDTQFLFVVAPNRGGGLSASSLIRGFSPSSVPSRHFWNAGLSSVNRFLNRRIASIRRGSSVSDHLSEHGKSKHNWLVVGDGVFSYCASIAEDLAKKNIQLYATLLEEKAVHNTVYKRSSQNKAAILSYCRIEDSTSTTESHLQHQINVKRNRYLLVIFMASASQILCQNGEIVISLCEGQGGFPASNAEEWKRSWLVPEYAARHGLVLRNLSPYELQYQQTSHRGKDRPWIKNGTDQRYTFTFPSEESIDRDLQMSCRHELRIVLPVDFEELSEVSRKDIIEGDAVFELTKNFVPEGIRMEVVAREILQPCFFNDEEVTLAIFLLNYSGESIPLTRDAADSIRSQLEASVSQKWGFDIAKDRRLVSRPYPTHLLPFLIKESYERQAKASISKR